MLRVVSRFLISLLFGLGIGVMALAVAGYLNIWKQTWQANFAIVDEVFEQQNTQPITEPTAPLALLPVLYNSSHVRLQLEDHSPSNDRYIPKETSVQNASGAMSALANISTKPTTPAQHILQKLKATTVVCPDVGTVYWDDCYGTFKTPWNVTYEGIWKEDKLNGFGTSINLTSGEIYIGEFINNMYNGCGTLTSRNGNVEHGIWKQNILIQADETCPLPYRN